MRVIKFMATKSERVSKQIALAVPTLNYFAIMKLIRQKNVRVCGKKVSSDILVEIGNEICVYFKESQVEIVYDDQNILVANKPRNIETTSDENGGIETLQDRLETQIKAKLFAVHRLDRNTAGLVIFAKNSQAQESLNNAIKSRKLEKIYWCLVFGYPRKQEELLVAYLKKDSGSSKVYISDTEFSGSVKIKTKYRLIKKYKDCSLLEVELITGKTHQIRAHLSHIGCFLVGDEKYGDTKLNKKFKMKYQCLTAKKIIFHFDAGDFLSYLDGKVVELDENKIDFLSKIQA